MQRYFVTEPSLFVGQKVTIRGEDFHHIVRVMRMKTGQQVSVAAAGQVGLASITAISKETVDVTIEELLVKDAEPPIFVTLIQGLPKGEKIDSIIRQACEVGVTQISIFTAMRSVGCVPWDKKEQRLTRWRKMAKESAEQAQRRRIPEIDHYDHLEQAILALPDQAVVLVPYEAQDLNLPTLKQQIQELDRTINHVAIVIGPEGGFDTKEIDQLKERQGRLLTLGPRILRTETAGIVVAANLLYEWN